MKYLIGLTSILFVECATVEPPKSFNLISDDNLKPYVTEFLRICESTLNPDKCLPNINLYVRTKELTDDTLGQCLVYDTPNFVRVIEIDTETLNSYNLRAVMFHELFHCVMGKPHYDNEIDIMNSYEYEQNTRYIYDNWDYFVGKVFKRE